MSRNTVSQAKHVSVTFGFAVFSCLENLFNLVIPSGARRNANIPEGADEREIAPYATVRLRRNAQAMMTSLETLPFQLRAPQEERALLEQSCKIRRTKTPTTLEGHL